MSSLHSSQFRRCSLSVLVLLPLIAGVPALLRSLPASAQATELQLALTSQEQSALRQGRVLFSGEEGNYTARVMATGSADTAWRVLTDYNNFSSFLPSVESSQLLESNGTQKKFEQVNAVRIFPITYRERVVISVAETYPSNLSFSMVDGDLEKLQGAWYVTGAGNQVMITHQVNIMPGGSNRRLFFRIYEDNLRKTMAAVKQEIERRSGS